MRRTSEGLVGGWALAVSLYLLACTALVLLTRPAWDARQLFPRHRISAERPWIPVTRAEPLVLELAPGIGVPEVVRFVARVPARAPGLTAEVRSVPDERLLGRADVERSGLVEVALRDSDETRPDEPRGLRLEVRSLAESDGPVPALAATDQGPIWKVQRFSSAGGEPKHPPLVHLGRGKGLSAWLLLWLLPLAACHPRLRRAELLVPCLALACTASSLVLWQRLYEVNVATGDPDGYGRAALVLGDLLAGRGELGPVRDYLHRYPHTHTALVSWILAPFLAAGVPMQVAYLLLNALVGFLTLALFERMLRLRLGLTGTAYLLGLLGFAAHLLVQRGFARPSPDVLGLFLAVASLDLVLARLAGPLPTGRRRLALLVLLHVLARPQGPALAALTAGGYAVAEALAPAGAWSRRELARTALAAAAPLLLLVPLYAGFGWLHNVGLSLQKAARYRTYWTPLWLAASILTLFQLLPLAWPWRGTRERRDARVWLLGWIGAYLVLVVLVRAPLWPRHFLPAVPAVLALAALGAAREGGRGLLARWVLGASAAANVLLLALQVVRFHPWLYRYQARRLPELLYRVLFE